MLEEKPLPPYTLIRSARRSMAIEVRLGGEVLVRVPRRVSDRAARGFVADNLDRVLAAIRRMRAYAAPQQADAEEEARLRLRAKAEMPGRAAYWCAQLGLPPAPVKITSAKKRWGSCSSNGSICFSYLLMRCPEPFIDYVALHEAAHLIHHDHSPAFYALIEQHMPDYKKRKKLLKAEGEET